MKRLFIWLLNKYSKTEKDRLDIIRHLDNNVQQEYYEQTPAGNVYNLFIEFMLSNEYIKEKALDNDSTTLTMIKAGIIQSFDESIVYINKEYDNDK